MKTAICHYCGVEVGVGVKLHIRMFPPKFFSFPNNCLPNQVRLVLPVVGKETCWEGDPILHLDKVHPELATKVDVVEQLDDLNIKFRTICNSRHGYSL